MCTCSADAISLAWVTLHLSLSSIFIHGVGNNSCFIYLRSSVDNKILVKALIGLTIYGIYESRICPANRICSVCKVFKKIDWIWVPLDRTHPLTILSSSYYCLIPTQLYSYYILASANIYVWDHIVVPGVMYRPSVYRCSFEKAVT